MVLLILLQALKLVVLQKYLHSNMVLLILRLLTVASAIVVDLHSNMVLLIYSEQVKNKIVSDLFTFQYGSTYIIQDNHNEKECFQFTFQYGSTYIDIHVLNARGHDKFTFQYGSTYMRKLILRAITYTEIYIPIWFYLYFLAHTLKYQVSLFTFQYGSTYIRFPHFLHL